MKKIFDTHAHYDDDAYNEDRAEVLNELKEQGVKKLCNMGADMASSLNTVKLTKQYDYIYGGVGVHPADVEQLEIAEQEGKTEIEGIGLLEKYVLENEKIVAIGEIGLDYHYDPCTEVEKAIQKKWFIRQLELARKLKVPVVIHSRDAAADTLDIMRSCHAEDIGGVVHCYSYSPEMAEIYVKMGYYIGIGGVVTFKNAKKLKETAEIIPLEKIVLETDAPYLAPEPYRGSRNSSAYIEKVAECIADIKNISVDEVYETTYRNAHELYKIPFAEM